MAEVTLTISAEDSISGVLTKVAQGLDKLTKRTAEAGASSRKTGEDAKTGSKGFDQFAGALNTAAANLKNLLTPANLIGSVIGIGMVAALRGAIAETRNYAMEMQRLTLVTGASLSEIGELQDAASKLGVGAGTLQRAFFLLSSEVESGGRNLAKLGISIRDASGAQRGDIELLKLMSTEFRKMSSATEQAVAAKKAFGRSAVSLLPVLTLTERQIEELGESGREFNKRFGEDGVKSAIRLGGAIDEVHEAFSRMHITMVSDLTPGVKLLADNFSHLVDVVWHIPKPIRLIVETTSAMVLVLGGAVLAIKTLAGAFAAFFIALKIPALATISVAIGSWAVPIAAVLAALTALLILGPHIIDFFASMIPQGVIDKWERFKTLVSTIWGQLKEMVRIRPADGYLDEGVRAQARQGIETGDREQTLAELQIEMGLKNRLLQIELALTKATRGATEAELFASEVKQRMAIDEINLELKKLSAREDADPQILKEREQLERAKTNIAKIGEAERAQIRRQAAIEEINLAKSVASAIISTQAFGEDLIREREELEILSAQKIFENSKKLNEDRQKMDVAITVAKMGAIQQLNQLEEQRLVQVLAINKVEMDVTAEHQKTLLDLSKANTEEELRIADELLSQRLISVQKHLAAQIEAHSKTMALRLQELQLESRLIDEQLKRDLTANAQRQTDVKDRFLKESQFVQDAALKQAGIQRQMVMIVKGAQSQIAGAIRSGEIKAWEETKEVMKIATEETKRLTDAQVELGQLTPIEALQRQKKALEENLAIMKNTRENNSLNATQLRELAISIAEDEARLKEFNKQLSITGQLERVFGGLIDIFSLFGIKLGKFILMLQGIPKAISGFREVFAGIGGVLTLGGTSLGLGGTAFAETARAVSALGNASGETAGVLGFFGGMIKLATSLLAFFANGLTGIFSIFGQIVQGIASGGGIVNTITSAFSGLVSSGGALYGVFNGLSNVGSALFSVFTEGTSLANIFQGAFDALGLTSGGFGGAAAASGGTVGTVNAAGSFASFLGQWVPVAGALFMAAQAIQNFFSGGAAVRIGTGIGLVLAGPFGGWLGGVIGGLFGKTPKGKLEASFSPFDRNNLGSILNTTVPGTQVGAANVDIGGNILKGSKERKLQEQLARMLNDILISVVGATERMLHVLPPAIATQLDSALTALESTGLEIVDKKWKGGKAGKKLSKRIEGLADEAIQDLFEALYGADITLKALGGGKRGGAGKGFDLVMGSLGLLSVIAERAGESVNLTNVSLAQFTQASVDLVKKFAKEKESFEDTLKRLSEGFGKLFQMIDQLSLEIAAANGDISVAFNFMNDAYQRAVDQMVASQDALTVAVESGAGPEEVVQAAEAAKQAMAATLAVLQQIDSALKSLGTATAQGANLFADLEATIRSIGGAATSVDDLLGGAEALASVVGDTSARISIFSASIRAVSLSVSDFISAMPRLQATLTQLLSEIRETKSPSEAIGQLKDLADAVSQGAANAIQSITANTQAAQAMAQDASNARVAALERERDAIQQVDRLQQEALQTQVDGIREWKRIAESVRSQLVDLFNLLAPTHPQTSLDEVLGQFRSAFSAFQGGPTVEGATQVQDLAKQVLTLAQQTPGYDLPSLRFQDLATEVRTALEAVQAVAENQPNELDLLAQITDLDQQQADRLQAIEAQIAAERDSLQATLQGISASEQAQIAQVHAMQAQALSQIRDEVRLRLIDLYEEQRRAREVLQQITGELTWEQFLVQKQAESVDMLTQIRDVLREYLGSIVSGLGLSVPAMAEGGYVPARPGGTLVRLGESGRGEFVVPEGRSSGKTEIIFSPHIEVHADSNTNGRKVAQDMIPILLEAVRMGPFRKEVQNAAKG